MTCQVDMGGIHPLVCFEQISSGNRIIHHFILNIDCSCCSSRKLLRIRVSPLVIPEYCNALFGQTIGDIPKRFVAKHCFVAV
ncbi:hypothetical protein D3C74_385490 [compost metagenome]